MFLQAYSQNMAQFDVFTRFYNELMFGESELSPLEREMIAVVVSSHNGCFLLHDSPRCRST